jgi:hypothetical protein
VPNNFDGVGNQFKMTQDAERLLKRTNENIKKTEVLVLADRRVRVSLIADEVLKNCVMI